MEYKAHAHIEVLKGKAWLHFAAPDMGEGRPDYLLDAVMAGEGLEYLRESTRAMAGEPVAGCHALPADISEVTKACYEHDQKAYGVHNVLFYKLIDALFFTLFYHVLYAVHQFTTF